MQGAGKLHRVPIFKILVPFVMGILFYKQFSIEPIWIVFSLIGLMLVCIVFVLYDISYWWKIENRSFEISLSKNQKAWISGKTLFITKYDKKNEMTFERLQKTTGINKMRTLSQKE